MKIFVIDFSKAGSLVEMCKRTGNLVECEQKDGALAYSKTREFMPDLIVVNYSEKPSHGRITAQKIHQSKRRGINAHWRPLLNAWYFFIITLVKLHQLHNRP